MPLGFRRPEVRQPEASKTQVFTQTATQLLPLTGAIGSETALKLRHPLRADDDFSCAWTAHQGIDAVLSSVFKATMITPSTVDQSARQQRDVGEGGRVLESESTLALATAAFLALGVKAAPTDSQTCYTDHEVMSFFTLQNKGVTLNQNNQVVYGVPGTLIQVDLSHDPRQPPG
ncbi:hypothetical protein FRC00_014568 [Tulasnella sp. 408]|nr:hypothetical protein FRC00_014568 [Tulasnella sp. 408]